MTWGQFGAAIDMLENAIRACPEALWSDPEKRPALVPHDVVGFWYVAFHAAFWLDLYLADSYESYRPPDGFTRDDREEGYLPERPYTRESVLDLLASGRERCRRVIAAMSDAEAEAPCGFPWLKLSRGELLLYNLRHVQHHAAQLNLLLRQGVDAAPRWVAETSVPLGGA